MTSRDGRSRSAFFWLPVTLLIVAALFAAGWYAAAHLVRARGQAIIAGLNAAGKTLDCRDAALSGFPVRFDVGCKAVGYKDGKAGLSFASGPAEAAMALYDPFRMNVSLHGPSSVKAPQTVPLGLDWKRLDAHLSLGLKNVTGITVEGDAVDIRNASETATQPQLLSLDAGSVTLAPSGGDLAVGVSLSNTAFGAALPDLQRLPPISATGSFRVFNGAGLLQTGLGSLRNRQFQIEGLKLEPGPDSSAAVSGNIAFDGDGLANGRLRVRLHNLKALSAMLIEAFPQEAGKIQPAFAMLGALGNDQTLPVEIRKGRVSLGFFKIGRLPPVD